MRVRTSLPVAAVVIAGTVFLSACGGSGDKGSDHADSPTPQATSTTTSAPSDDSTADADPTASTSAPGDDGTAAAPVTVKVDKSLTDEVKGDKATVITYIRGYQPSAAAKSKFSALEDEQVILVNVKMTAGSKYYGSLGADSWYLTDTPNGIDDGSTTILDDEIKAAGYPPLPEADTGKTTTGWVVFTPRTNMDHFVLRYKRLAANTSDGKSIPAKNYDIKLG